MSSSTATTCFSALQRAENSSNHSSRCLSSPNFGFSALQRAENSSNERRSDRCRRTPLVSVLFSEPKIPQIRRWRMCLTTSPVSVLFSEPKIPQSSLSRHSRCRGRKFQCSSASRKFLKPARWRYTTSVGQSFSALQRAENSSNWVVEDGKLIKRSFSALQRAENSSNADQNVLVIVDEGFSALQRAENSSNRSVGIDTTMQRVFQCSSASRKFLKRMTSWRFSSLYAVSVLFSEPKIPQNYRQRKLRDRDRGFSALQRAENSSNAQTAPRAPQPARVSVLFSEPKIPQNNNSTRPHPSGNVSVLFSEPKIPQTDAHAGRVDARGCFSALQRAENSSNIASTRLAISSL